MSRDRRPQIMGILNVTPDSFSDGGRFLHRLAPEEAERRRAAGLPWTKPGEPIYSLNSSAVFEAAQQLLTAGADLIDIGGESTRPGAEPVPVQEEIRRVMPVFQELFMRRQLPVSLDTRHPDTVRSALVVADDRASELIINDVSGLLTDPEMPALIAEYGCQIVVMHNRGDSRTMQEKTDYDAAAAPALLARLRSRGVETDGLEEGPGVVAGVLAELLDIRQMYLDAGVDPARIILDPGIGFAKTHAQNWELIRNLHRFTELTVDGTRHRVLFGASRKGFLGTLLADAHGNPRPADQRETATAALSMYAAAAGCWAVRVHSPAPTADALAVMEAVGSRRSVHQRMPE